MYLANSPFCAQAGSSVFESWSACFFSLDSIRTQHRLSSVSSVEFEIWVFTQHLVIPCQQLLSVGATDAEDKADMSHTSARTRLTAANKTRLLKPPDTSKISALQSLYRSDDCATGQQSTTYCTDRWRQVRGKRRDFERRRTRMLETFVQAPGADHVSLLESCASCNPRPPKQRRPSFGSSLTFPSTRPAWATMPLSIALLLNDAVVGGGLPALAGLLHFMQEFQKFGDPEIPGAWRALCGWRILTRPRSRQPVAWPIRAGGGVHRAQRV